LALDAFYKEAGGGEVIVLYDFHTSDPNDMNFSAIRSLVESGYKVGYTPQGRLDWLDYMAIGLGASFLEKRLTLSRDIPENGHWKAHDPGEFELWLKNVKECYQAIGDGHLRPTEQDLLDSKKYYKSAWLKKSALQGAVITEDYFEFKRPGTGISSREVCNQYVGKEFQRDY
jgi:sialic acid synthase SpsE